MERPTRFALVLLVSVLSACAEGTDGDPVDDGGTAAPDTSEQDAAVDDTPTPPDDAPLDPVDTSVTPDVSLPDASLPDVQTPDVPALDRPSPLDVVAPLDGGSSELDTGVVDVPALDVPRLDVLRLDVSASDSLARDVPDAPTDAPTDVPTDTPTDAPADAGCPSGSSLCAGSCVDHHTNPAVCSAATNLGSFCGDTSCGTLCPSTRYRNVATRTGLTSQWFRARAVECSLCGASTVARVNLTVPPGVDYDLFIHRPCGTIVGRSLNLAGVNDQVEVTESESPLSDDSFDYYIEVRHISGASCAPWTLTIEARGPNGSSC
jgi:hypothetical protein